MDMKVVPEQRSKVLEGIEKTEELSYFRFLANKYGFTVPNDWEKVKKGINQTLDNPSSLTPDATEANLKLVADALILTSNSVLRCWNSNTGNNKKLNEVIEKLDTSNYHKNFFVLYPNRVNDNFSIVEGAYLTSSYTFKDAASLVFSVITKKRILDGDTVKIITQHNFSVVYIPKNKARIEIRLSSQVDKIKRDDAFRMVQEEMFNFLGINSVGTEQLTPINFYDAIESCFKDKLMGRAASATLSTDESASDAILKNLSNKNYCARTQKVSDDSGKGHEYTCRAVQLRWNLPDENKCQAEISIEPHKFIWEQGKCYQISFKHPKSRLELDRLIDNVIARTT